MTTHAEPWVSILSSGEMTVHYCEEYAIVRVKNNPSGETCSVRQILAEHRACANWARPTEGALQQAREALEACIPNLEIARNRMGMESTSIDLARRALAALAAE